MSTPRQPWYREFFKQDYLGAYGPTLTEERTAEEVAFVERVLELGPGSEVLDLCCGYGRHAIPLAKRGYRVTGLDLSAEFLEQARERASAEDVELETVHADMREVPFEGRFDAVIDMFSSFGYLESEADDLKVLCQAAKALKKGGRLLVDVINREWVVSNYVQDERREDPDGTVYLEHRDLDLVASRNHVDFTIVSPEGALHRSVGLHMRLYTLTETIRMLEQAGLSFDSVHGGFDGCAYGVDARRMIVVSRKA